LHLEMGPLVGHTTQGEISVAHFQLQHWMGC